MIWVCFQWDSKAANPICFDPFADDILVVLRSLQVKLVSRVPIVLLVDFLEIAKPLTKLRKGTSVWDQECQAAFERHSMELKTQLIHWTSETKRRCIIPKDACNTYAGNILSEIQDGQEKVIGYLSKMLSKPESNNPKRIVSCRQVEGNIYLGESSCWWI